MIALIIVRCGILLMMEFYNASSISQLWQYSGRMVAIWGAQSVFADRKFLFGYGLTNKTDFLAYASSVNKVFIMDSSYIYYFVHSGIFGSIIIILILFFLLKRLIRTRTRNKKFKNYIIAMFFTFLFTGLFETTVFYSGMPISFVFSIIILQYIVSNFKIEQDIQITESA